VVAEKALDAHSFIVESWDKTRETALSLAWNSMLMVVLDCDYYWRRQLHDESHPNYAIQMLKMTLRLYNIESYVKMTFELW